MEIAVMTNAPHQVECGIAVVEGLAKIGVKARRYIGQVAPSDVVVCWGWRNGKRYQAQGKSVLVMERGYLGDRFNWFSLGWNGLNGYATFIVPEDMGDRFDRHFSLHPWKTKGDYVLIAGQVPGDMSLRGKNLEPWYQEATVAALEAYNLPVRFRAHPNVMKNRIPTPPQGAVLSRQSLDEDLASAAVCITWNSNTGVDAVLAGVPTVTMDRGSMAWEVSAHTIGEYSRPDRHYWANKLAWCQWRLEEIANGDPFVNKDVFWSCAKSGGMGASILHTAA